MKRLTIFFATLLITNITFAQKDSSSAVNADTIKVGNFVIIKKNKEKNAEVKSDDDNKGLKLNLIINDAKSKTNYHKKRNANISTNWFIFDLGFTNVRDNTNYTSLNPIHILSLKCVVTDLFFA